MVYLYIFIGGGLGSVARFAIGKLTHKLIHAEFPLGTLVANLLACVLLAIIVTGLSQQMEKNAWIQPLFLIGFCGGFSTFSTFGNETFDLLANGNYTYAILNVLLSVVAAIGLIWMIKSRI